MAFTQLALILGGCFLALALVFVLIGVIRLRMTRGWIRTTAIVINSRTGETTGLGGMYPTFQWADQFGRNHRRTSMVRQSFPPQPGARLAVKFDPKQPDRAIIDTAVQNGTLFLVLGIVIAVLGVLIGAMLLLVPRLLQLPPGF